jgi:hypothetical protein
MRGTYSNKMAAVMLAALLLVSTLFGGASAYADNGGGDGNNVAEKLYYVDSESGDDTNDGKSANSAWKSLSKANAFEFQPGDKLLFKAGGVWDGQFKPQGSGTADAPIIVDMYGTGDKPRIDANGAYEAAVVLENIEYWEVNNLELTNLGQTMEKSRFGVVIRVKDFGIMRHIYVRNLYVHDVNGWLPKLNKEEGAGIYFEALGPSESKFDDLRIENNHLRTVDRNGIAQYYDFGYHRWKEGDPAPTKKSYRSTNIIVRSNLLEDIGGDGIKIWGSDGTLVEHNVVRGAQKRSKDASAGIWPFDSNNTLIQYNEVSGVHGTVDGQAFDADFFTTNTIFQYNYSHNNDGGFMLLCSPGIAYSDGTIVRYNVSVNDGSPGSSIFQFGGKATNSYIYNNTIYVGKEKAGYPVFRAGSWEGGSPSVANFFNNVFYIEAELTGYGQLGQDFMFSNNVFFDNGIPNRPADAAAITEDPQFVKPGGSEFGIESLWAYSLKENSPAIQAGKIIDVDDLGTKMLGTPEFFLDMPFANDNADKDLFGRSVAGTPDLGAIAYPVDTARANRITDTPEITALTQVSAGTIELTFDGVENVESYVIEYGPVYGYGDRARKIQNVTSTNIAIPGLNEEQYFFRVAAHDGVREGFFGAEKRLNVSNNYIEEDFETGEAEGWTAVSGEWDIGSTITGKTALNDSFDNGTGNWTADASWSIVQHDGNNMYDISMGGGDALTGSAGWKDYAIEADIIPRDYGEWGAAALLFRHAGAGNAYMVLMNETHLILRKAVNNAQSTISQVELPTPAGTARHVKAVVVGNEIEVYVDGIRRIKETDSALLSGKAGLNGYNVNASFDNVKITVVSEELFNDSFDNGAAKWTGSGGAVAEHGGNYTYDIAMAGGEAVAGAGAWTNYILEADITPTAYDQWGTATLLFRYANGQNNYLLLLTADSLLLKKAVGGVQSNVGNSVPMETVAGTTRHLKVSVIGDQIKVYVDNELKLQTTDSSLSAGKIGLSTWNAAASFDNVRVEGIYQVDSNHYEQTVVSGGETVAGVANWSDYSFEATVKPVTLDANGSIGLSVRYTDSDNKYEVAATGSKLELRKVVGGQTAILSEKGFALATGQTYSFKVEADGEQIKVWVDGQLELSAQDAAFAAGKVSLNMTAATGQFDDIKVIGISGGQQLGAPIPAWSTVQQPSANAELAGLSVSGVVLTPAFAADVYEYAASVSNGTASVTITASKANNNAIVHINEAEGESRSVGLTEGNNEIKVEVTAQDGVAKKTYRIAINRASGGSGSTGSGDTTPQPTATPIPEPEASTVLTPEKVFGGRTVAKGTIQVKAAGGNDGAATANVTSEQAEKAMRQAEENAAGQGSGASTVIEVKVSAASDAKEVRVSLPMQAIQMAASREADALSISTSLAAISFDRATLVGLSQHSLEELTVAVRMADANTLNAAARAAVGDRPVFDFRVFNGEKAVNSFAGKVAVTIPYKAAQAEDPAAIVVYYINEQGTPEVVRNAVYDASAKTITFRTSHFSTYAVGYNKIGFTDVSESAWYNEAVSFIAARGITTGTSASEYSPEATLTRGQFIVLLMRALDMAPLAGATDNFSDAGQTYYTDYLAMAKKAAIVQGVGGNRFEPDKSISRQEMFTMLYRALLTVGYFSDTAGTAALAGYEDVGEIAEWAGDAVGALVERGIVNGSGNKLMPGASTTRAHMAQIIFKVMTSR